MAKHVMMIIANSPNPAYFKWFAELNHKEKAFKLSFIFLHTECPALVEEVKKYDVESHWFYFNTYKSKPLQYIKMLIKLYFLFRKLKPDVVEANLFDDALPSMLAARLAGVPKRVIMKQDTGYHVRYAPSVVKFDKFNNFNATHLVAVSEESKEFILKHENGDASKITLIHSAVDERFITSATNEQVNAIKTRFNLHNKTVVGMVARYIPLKGYNELIEAAEILVPNYPYLVFLGVGYGAQLKELRAIIKSKKLEDNFILTDLLDFSLMPAVYKALDIYVHAAKIEPFGFVLVEAMFNKKPVVTTRVGCARDVMVHKQNAYLVDFDSSKEIAEGIEFILKNPNNNLAENAYKIAVENFSRETTWSKYRNLFLS